MKELLHFLLNKAFNITSDYFTHYFYCAYKGKSLHLNSGNTDPRDKNRKFEKRHRDHYEKRIDSGIEKEM
jgi:hypothetical protein